MNSTELFGYSIILFAIFCLMMFAFVRWYLKRCDQRPPNGSQTHTSMFHEDYEKRKK